jgi:hypothetical protein
MYLYRKTMQAVTLATASVVFSFTLQAQFQIPAPERKTPRAVGVLETFKNGSRRLVPVTFFYEKHYYDATFYHATPVPFTLYSETVYEIQQYGKPMGIFTVQSATEISAVWFGNGRYKPLPDAFLQAKKKIAPIVLEDPSKPVLHRRAGSEGDSPTARPAPAPSVPEAEEDPDRPKLHRRDRAGSASSDTSTQTPAQGPAAHSPAGSAAEELTPSDDPDHPVLRRGKPVREQGGRDLPDFKREEPISRQVAISDAGPSETHSLIYLCPPEERSRIEASARELAQAELRRMAAQRGLALPALVKTAAVAKTTASGKATGSKRVAAVTAPAPPELNLDDEQFVPYDLDYGNYATVVFSARYTPEAALAMSAKAKSWMVTVVARQDEDKLIKLYSAVSDPRELNLYPELRLVDALDPDGSGRAALLFREQKQDGVSWLMGRLTVYGMQTVFETPSR